MRRQLYVLLFKALRCGAYAETHEIDNLFLADLSAAVDVYSDWVDACDAVAKEDGEERAGKFAPSRAPASERPGTGRARDDEDDDDEDDDDADIMEDEDGLGGYRGEGIAADDEEI
jgi:hypothetical protein